MGEKNFTEEDLYNIETASPNKTLALREWSESSFEKAQQIVDCLKTTFPEFKVYSKKLPHLSRWGSFDTIVGNVTNHQMLTQRQ